MFVRAPGQARGLTAELNLDHSSGAADFEPHNNNTETHTDMSTLKARHTKMHQICVTGERHSNT